ncbi:hypothetical protein [Alloactinosynnema sp. L-07]|nr:hypothetical protein [Alloactinosynnema sp. L-07]
MARLSAKGHRSTQHTPPAPQHPRNVRGPTEMNRSPEVGLRK